jgi:hypothetical protein
MVACLHIGQFEPKDFFVEVLGALEVSEVELNTSETKCRRSHGKAGLTRSRRTFVKDHEQFFA